jgi:hypothetical protein
MTTDVKISGAWLLALALLLAGVIYWPGLNGGYWFDDYPNIVNNPGVHPTDAQLSSLVAAALSSPSSEFKRPLASLSFAVQYLATGLDPYWMKLGNLLIHLLNGVLCFVLSRMLIARTPRYQQHADVLAALVSAGWLLLPIHITVALYVVQRMESLANLFVLLGLIGYWVGRQWMPGRPRAGIALCTASLAGGSLLGLSAKETAVLLPLYALAIEYFLLRGFSDPAIRRPLTLLYLLTLAVPMVLGLVMVIPRVLAPGAWANRDFNLGERLLSEARIVLDYIVWTLLPTPSALSFYHDDFQISRGWLRPWQTLPAVLTVLALGVSTFLIRRKAPLPALGLALFLAEHTLTATILPLELIFEHRNYFASFGLLLALIPPLACPPVRAQNAPGPFALPARALLATLMLVWTAETAMSARAWASPLRWALESAARAPASPRAQYALGKTYIVHSRYEPGSPFIPLARETLEGASTRDGGSVLPEQALIYLSSRLGTPIEERWWDRMAAKLARKRPSAEDDGALMALARCARDGDCPLPPDRMVQMFLIALDHPSPSASLLAAYGDYAWNVLEDHDLGETLARDTVKAAPREPVYRITLLRMLLAQGKWEEARQQLTALEAFNTRGRLDRELAELKQLMPTTP